MNIIDYPNPQMRRKNFISLNNNWNIENVSDSKIIYKKSFSLNNLNAKANTYLLHFEAVDYCAKVELNGKTISLHKGGFTPWSVDISCYVKRENTLIVKVDDETKKTQILGKQSWTKKPFGCFYTPTIGIWGEVWLEKISSKTYVKDFFIDTNLEVITLFFNKEFKGTVDVKISYQNKDIQRITSKKTVIPFKINHKKLWSYNNPNLYDVEISVNNGDVFYTYFGYSKIEINKQKIYLNGKELYQKLILNQGYCAKTGMILAPDIVQKDIICAKYMGLNGFRFHQKIESYKALYLCDKLGMLVWAEFPSAHSFTENMIDNFLTEYPHFIKKYRTHPSVITYVPFNESWGVSDILKCKNQEYFVNAIYYLTKSLDNTRPVVGNDGWENALTDIFTLHDYNQDANKLFADYKDKAKILIKNPAPNNGPDGRESFVNSKYKELAKDKPFMLTEYGGVGFDINSNNKDSWGYGDKAVSANEVIKRIKDLTKQVKKISYCSGFCYTQMTDIEQEVNGFLDANHNYKFNKNLLKNLFDV
jgi:beta-galactosidase/beta-glucuronidase